MGTKYSKINHYVQFFPGIIFFKYQWSWILFTKQIIFEPDFNKNSSSCVSVKIRTNESSSYNSSRSKTLSAIPCSILVNSGWVITIRYWSVLVSRWMASITWNSPFSFFQMLFNSSILVACRTITSPWLSTQRYKIKKTER